MVGHNSIRLCFSTTQRKACDPGWALAPMTTDRSSGLKSGKSEVSTLQLPPAKAGGKPKVAKVDSHSIRMCFSTAQSKEAMVGHNSIRLCFSTTQRKAWNPGWAFAPMTTDRSSGLKSGNSEVSTLQLPPAKAGGKSKAAKVDRNSIRLCFSTTQRKAWNPGWALAP